MLVTGQRVLPAHAEQLGFRFTHRALEPALRESSKSDRGSDHRTSEPMTDRAFHVAVCVRARPHGDRQSPRRAAVAEDEVKRINEADDRARRDHGGGRQGGAALDHGKGRRHRGVSVAAQGRPRASAASAAAASSACATRRPAAGRRRRSSRITGGSIGAQIGVQAIDLVLVINDQRGLEQLVKNQFKVGADARWPRARSAAMPAHQPTSRCARRSSATRARADCLRA